MAKILVVEDESSLNKVLQSTLQDVGHEVMTAFEGMEAIHLCQDNEFDLVISDVRLPGMDGIEVLEQVQKFQANARCVVITGYASDDVPVRAIRLKVDDYLFKPFSLRFLLSCVERVLKPRGEGSPRRSLFRKIFSWTSPKEKVLEKAVLEREGVFQGLYVGVRSGFLSPRAGLDIYSELEKIDQGFRRLLTGDAAGPEEIREVREVYKALHDRLSQYEQQRLSEPSTTEEISLEQFKKLFEAIKANDFSIEELQYAPLLRTAPDARFEAMPEMLELKRKLWPQTTEN